ncbi:Uncharacterised protein [Klebsiella pneumoniae]|nr:Uncharacterised protein [Klebsiella pneumoniae]
MITVIIEYIFIFLSKKQLIKNASFGVVIVRGKSPFTYSLSLEVDFKSFRLSLGTASKQPHNWNESRCIELIVRHEIFPLLISVIECGSCIRLT